MEKIYESIPCLGMIESEIYILDFEKNLFDSYLFHINQIVERTESQVSINIVFKDIPVKFTIYEDIFTNIYLSLLQMGSRFLNEKVILVLFPQLDDRKFNTNENTYFFSHNLNSYQNFIKIEDDITITRDPSFSISESKNKEINIFEYDHVCVGGSFDHFHIGHYVCYANLDLIDYFYDVNEEVFIDRFDF